ncbi:phenylalanine--tRNA ligase subunit alpha [Candidatus Roizmanbacteria bacterium CG22_combo_CG10-13_8_21_14_all_38_20]|uniref:Phenylalanine--tRNA ligase alpha subunit n=1 Tax=Candidatus Roizmanbacteria bacterium CG22_combo_CG10-13_8_21_14_all_38_20 TaxID=1974862 RepID=A0A2H0BVH6_9BACT|nr:phenylalanine--tRNA ligase subunit alpha [Candidatus Microgenomates bacterium]PIP61604.1 MAG: phenylalanine--tRNA ligase subunit alpha [Candidatus Roizmanbacteria bacterium CG22_combo_CG10-13_8_21_14_all_38_20]PJC30574.1 MAG: phenylalanine--tRNA ligase subunit alpha [Candidatus Roizmanbacteria bacterium CG_4_9_14_0_2_um_filter_38_17]
MDILEIKQQAELELAKITSGSQLELFRVKYLGKQGLVTNLLRKIPKLDILERGKFGVAVNELKQTVEDAVSKHIKILATIKSSPVDLSVKTEQPRGTLHPVTQAIEQITDIFSRIGFNRVAYPEVDWDWYAFESLNMPKGHPARDEWETFFVDHPQHSKLGKLVLTPHTSNGQVREMQRLKKPPMRMINIARCYRRQQDLTHTFMFHQFEGLVIDTDINLSHLKGTFEYFAKEFYGPDTKIRFRPFHFQFTEPSMEVDFSCVHCKGKGCKFCKSGWHEVGGSGMIHPNVLRAGGIDPDKYTGYAFGWGVERTLSLRPDVQIDDIRKYYNNDIRFLKQF